jgi:hypothetical protein
MNTDSKNTETKQCTIPVVVCSATPQIKSWLEADDSGRKWKQGENPNCFTNNRLEALYVYEDYIKYWEDIRAQSVVVEHRIPESKNELYLVI